MKAREFDAKDIMTEPDAGSDPADDRMVAVLEDDPDDPVLQELTFHLRSLRGRADRYDDVDDSTIEDWQSLRDEVARPHSTRTSHVFARQAPAEQPARGGPLPFWAILRELRNQPAMTRRAKHRPVNLSGVVIESCLT
jgi:hypothetical protein